MERVSSSYQSQATAVFSSYLMYKGAPSGAALVQLSMVGVVGGVSVGARVVVASGGWIKIEQ